jgi:tetratricopeptide (TPR) repeat protein
MSAVAADPRPSNRWLYPMIGALLAASIAVQVVRDRGWEPYYPEDPTMWVQSSQLAKRLSLGFDPLVSDIYWIRAVLYYGGKHRAEGRRSYALLYPLLELVTELDPHFRVAYRFGAIFLAEGYPGGAGRPELAIKLLQRGIEQDQPRWDYYHDIGFVYYWWLQDYKTAAEWFARGADRPGAAEWLRPLAATTLAYGGDRQSSRMLWTELLNGSDSEWLRSNAEHRLKQLDAMDVIDKLAHVVGLFAAREGRPPRNWQELMKVERLPGAPLDSTGKPFVLDPVTGRVDVARDSELWPLPMREVTTGAAPAPPAPPVK